MWFSRTSKKQSRNRKLRKSIHAEKVEKISSQAAWKYLLKLRKPRKGDCLQVNELVKLFKPPTSMAVICGLDPINAEGSWARTPVTVNTWAQRAWCSGVGGPGRGAESRSTGSTTVCYLSYEQQHDYRRGQTESPGSMRSYGGLEGSVACLSLGSPAQTACLQDKASKLQASMSSPQVHGSQSDVFSVESLSQTVWPLKSQEERQTGWLGRRVRLWLHFSVEWGPLWASVSGSVKYCHLLL